MYLSKISGENDDDKTDRITFLHYQSNNNSIKNF